MSLLALSLNTKGLDLSASGLTYPLWLGIVAMTGAAIGSFLNVVIHRMPEGRSLWRPPSSCPTCGHRIFFLYNLPLVGWMSLLGRCRYCRTPISFRYPLVELVCAILFGGLFWCYYDSAALYQTGITSGLRPEFYHNGPTATWAILGVHLILVACLFAATVIDARWYIIPLPIPWFATVIALIALPLSSWYFRPQLVNVKLQELFPVADAAMTGPILGCALGLGVAQLLLMLRLLPRSFEPEPAPPGSENVAPGNAANDLGTPEQWLAYPHARREVLKECIFLLFPLLGLMAGWRWPLSPALFHWEQFPLWSLVLAGVIQGYLAGGAIVWIIRIGGTLVFGKEAMGLGDVHLLAAIGAVVGAQDSVLIFFLAPFLGLGFVLLSSVAFMVMRKRPTVLPYGPFLAAAALLVMAARLPLYALLGIL